MNSYSNGYSAMLKYTFYAAYVETDDKKTSAGHQKTTYSSATFLVELRTCFQTENGKAIQLVPTLSQYMHMQGKDIQMTS